MPDVSSRSFDVFGQSIYWYGVLIALGIALAVACAWLREKRIGLPKETTLNLSLLVVPAGLIFARAYYVAFSWSYFRQNPGEILNIRSGGMAVYGGIIGGLFVAVAYARVKRISFWRVADLFAPSVALAQSVGRWGNFVNQEAYGTFVADPRFQFFPLSVFIRADQGWHWATFFYESVWCFLIFLALMLAEQRNALKRAGDGFLLYALLYAAERFFVEGLRTDSLLLGNIRVSQLLSLLALTAVALAFVLRARKEAGVKASWGILMALFFAQAVSARAVGAPPSIDALSAAALCVLALALYRKLPHHKPYETQRESRV